MTQRNVEILIGQLLTDEGCRQRFLADPARFLRELLNRGTHLTPNEMSGLIAMDSTLWDSVAERVDPRLQKAQLRFTATVDSPPRVDGDD
jgi:hypothetical protein